MAAADYAAPQPTEVGTVNSIGQAVEFFDNLSSSRSRLNVFRGHANIAWQVVPSIFRDDMNVLGAESRLIRDLIALYPSDFDPDHTMFDRLVRMQHFGLRTRLMDVSRNPLAALYFAVEEGDCDGLDGAVVIVKVPEDRIKYYDSDSVSCISNLANLTDAEKMSIESTSARTIKELHELNSVDRLYQFIRAEKPEFRPRIRREDLFKPYFVYPKMNNKRIIAQNGAFVVFGLSRTKGPKVRTGIRGDCIRIPAKAKPGIRRSLEKLGYDDSTLFPDIERAARQIMRGYDISSLSGY
jgi:hypothetical protein